MRTTPANHPWLRSATILCILFGLLFTLNVHPIGDGSWFWYAQALRHGQSLYGDLHAPMQPLFFLATALNQAVFGSGWLAGKILAAAQVIVYCIGLFFVCRRVAWTDRARAVLLVAVFGMTIMAFYSRFDDFHVTGHCLVVYSIFLLLRLRDQSTGHQILQSALLLGALSGLAMANRLNDGGLLFAAVAACLLVFARTAKVRGLLAFTATAFGLFVVMILLTRSTLHDWLYYTIRNVAAMKGGTHSVLLAPTVFPQAVLTNLLVEPRLILDFCLTCIVAGLFAYAAYFRAFTGNRYRLAVKVVTALCAIPPALFLLQQALLGKSVLAVSDVFGLLLCGLLFFFPLRLLHLALLGRTAEWNRLEILLLLPFGQLFAGAMTSGGSILEAYTPLAFFLLLVPFLLPAVLQQPWRRAAFASVLCLLAAGTLIAKSYDPYRWLHYSDGPLLEDRTWYRHPSFGPMVIERPQLAFMQSMCAAIKPSTTPPQLLAMPWPYPNYFCNIPPWHGYIQTWYDTSTRQTIGTLVHELQTSPPEWIVYQRSFETLRAHENTFAHGAQLPHRALDTLVVTQLRAGNWSLPWQRCFGGTDWLVVHTRPAAPGEPNEDLLPYDDHVNLCSRTN